MTDDALRDAILAALRPAGLREALRLRIGGGYTCLQVVERLRIDAREGAEDPVSRRREVDRVHHLLLGLAAEGKVRKGKSAFGAELRGKGYRGVLVDVYRLA